MNRAWNVEAIVAHSPQALPLAPTVHFTEHSRELPLGDGAGNATEVIIRTADSQLIAVRKESR